MNVIKHNTIVLRIDTSLMRSPWRPNGCLNYFRTSLNRMLCNSGE